MIKHNYPFLFVVVFSLVAIFSYKFVYHREFLTFSDGAKFADIGRGVVLGEGYNSNFSNFATKALGFDYFVPVSRWTPPAMPLAIAGFFKIFGISDSSVIATSSIFYLLLVLTTYLLGKKLWGNLVGVLGALAVVSNINLLEYASSGASETLFAFEIILGAYLFILKKKWGNFCGFTVIFAMYFTRAQAIIYIFGLLFLFFLLNFSIKKALGYFVGSFIVGSLIYLFVSKQGLFAVTQHLPGVASSAALRGGIQDAGILDISKKLFYNLYNFFRLMPQIMSPYLWTLFVIGVFKWGRDRVENSFKSSVIFMVVVTFLVTALTIPLFRYLHPIVPLVYLFGVSTLVWILQKVNEEYRMLNIGKFKKYFSDSTSKFVILSSIFCIVVFVVGHTLGVIFLDSRFTAKRVNKNKPPVYVVLSKILKENTGPGDVVVTNLDTWGSWYGERKTIWYPLKPEQLDLNNGENLFDAIFLTSFLIDDENYFMGPEWRQAFLNPENIEDRFLVENYRFAGEFSVPADETYEKQDGRAVLLVRK